MKIINEGYYDIEQFVVDIAKLEHFARVCYQSDQDRKGLTGEKFIDWLILNGHESVIEHSLITVTFNNASRGFTHEMVRHRLCSISQESTRYTDPRKGDGEFKVIMKAGLDLDKKYSLSSCSQSTNEVGNLEEHVIHYKFSVRDWLELNEQMYIALLNDGWEKNDARGILPTHIKSQIVVSANVREWRHILKARTSHKAHWEIRGLMRKLLGELQQKVPVIFDDIIYDQEKLKQIEIEKAKKVLLNAGYIVYVHVI